MKRTSRAVLAVLLLLSLVGAAVPVTAQDASPVASTRQEGAYADPAGRYTVPVPTNWTVEEREELVVLADPDGDITVSIAVIEGSDAKTGINEAWAIVNPSFDPAAQDGAIEQEVPSSPGIDTTLVITYDLGQASGNVLQAAGLVGDGHVYVLIFKGSLDAVIRRASQVQIISSGFKPTGFDEADLRGATAKPFSGPVVTEFEAYVEDLMGRTDVPGASVAVVQNGKVVYAKGFGVKKSGETEPVTPDTLMMIGSTTKSMTTMMMATEVDDGLMRWDEPVVEILPSFAVADPDLSRTMTVRNLVCACTGVPRRDLELAFNAAELTPEDVIASLKEFEFSTAFGEAFQYSNQMVATGGYIAAIAAGGQAGDLGETYARALQQRVLDPIGMERTTLSIDAVEADGDYAIPHGLSLDFTYAPLTLETESFVAPVAPAGAIWSSANEMARYLQTELADGVAPDGTRVVSETNLEETWQPRVAVDAETDYGLGWFVGKYKGLNLIDHGGNTYGFSSDFAFLPDEGIGIVVLANAQGSNLFNEGVRYRLFELLYDQPMENDQQIVFATEQLEQTKTDVEAQLADSAERDQVEDYLHTYDDEVLGEITIEFADGRLYLDAGEFRTELRPLQEPMFGRPVYVMFDAPLAGVPVDLRQNGDDGRPEVEIRAGTDVYVFTLEEETPVASPVAVDSPAAN